MFLKLFTANETVSTCNKLIVVPLRNSVGEVVTPSDRQLRPIERDDVLGSISWADDLSRDQDHINELPEEHKTKREKLETSDAVIS